MPLCPNCQSDRHLECCERCGALVPTRRRQTGFCTARCASRQSEADRLSAAMERAEQDLARLERFLERWDDD